MNFRRLLFDPHYLKSQFWNFQSEGGGYSGNIIFCESIKVRTELVTEGHFEVVK